MKAHIDFETRSKVDIKKSGAYKYAEDESTEILCLQYAIGDAPPQLWTPDLHPPVELLDFIKTGQPVVAHNAFFEIHIWRLICHKRFGWADIPLEQWRCSAAKTSSYALPRSLDKAGRALNLSEDLIKDDSGKRVMLKLSKPRKATKHDDSEWHEGVIDYGELYAYCEQDVVAERAIDHQLKDIRPQEQTLWQYDQVINDRGVQVDLEVVNAAISMLKDVSTDLALELQLITDNKVKTLKQTTKIIDYCRENFGYNIPNLQKPTVESILNSNVDNLPFEVVQILNLRRMGGMSSVSKYQALANAACSDGRIRDILMFHGASIGRWAGKLVQIQNLPRGILTEKHHMEEAISAIKQHDLDALSAYGNPMDVLSSCIRGMFIASEGKDLIAADYNAIETRVLWWLADNERGLDIFRSGKCPYIDMAASIYNVLYGEIPKSDPRRQLGKTAILGLGFGMGATKFLGTCLQQKIAISPDLAAATVKIYRDVHKPVVTLWAKYEHAARAAILNEGSVFTAGKVKWFVHGKFLHAKLPSGRCLSYAYPSIRQKYNKAWDKDTEQICFYTVIKGQWVEDSTYGGKLTENITQAVARDLLAEAIIRCENSGYPVVMHVHDEIVAEVEKDFGSVEAFEDILCQSGDWAKEIPVKAEGWRGQRYRK